MKVTGEARHIIRPKPYATAADFCQIFCEQMNSLYLMSFLLTADREKAEQAFAFALEDSLKGDPVFSEWARAWARRSIMQSAIRIMVPQPINVDAANPAACSDTAPPTEPAEIAAIRRLPTFERFVYVMAILERCSDHDCSILLGCARREVVSARTRALQQVGCALNF
jgi:hypothetical protein